MLEYLLLHDNDITQPRRPRLIDDEGLILNGQELVIQHPDYPGTNPGVVTLPVRCVGLQKCYWLGNIWLLGCDGRVYRIFQRGTPMMANVECPVNLTPYFLK